MSRLSMWAVVAVALLLVLTVAAFAQPPEPPGPPGGQGERERAGFRGERAPDAAARWEAFRMMQQPVAPAIAVADGFVYVVFGGTLFQFQVDGLKLVAQAQLAQMLPRPTPPGAPQPAPQGTAPAGPAPIPPMPGMPGPQK